MRVQVVLLFLALVVYSSGCTEQEGAPNTVVNAMESGNPNACSDLKEDSIRDACYSAAAIGNLSVDYCMRVKSDQSRNICIMGVAIGTLDEGACGRISDANQQKSCRESVQAAHG
ncbi:Uncharacterised protein [uncultured archaeon]|nr:Uncharacterised protein [uncultured archaeon]